MSENQRDPQYKLRWSEELRDKVADSAKEHNRSMNADIVARLEQSFKNRHFDLIEDTVKIEDKVITKTYDDLYQEHLRKKIINLDFYLERLDLKISAIKFILSSLEREQDQSAIVEALKKYKILLEANEIERENIHKSLHEAYDESNVDTNFLIDNQIKAVLNKKYDKL